MTFVQSLEEALPGLVPALLAMPVLLVPFVVAEQLWPARGRPGWRDYGFNILISWSTLLLALPAGVAAGLLADRLRSTLAWTPLPVRFDDIGRIPFVGGGLEVLAMMFVPLLVHDIWFYWAHRIEHRVAVLWEFHKLHHSDPQMNCSTFARDHFLQAAWVSFFPIFTLGLVIDVDAVQSGQAGVLSGLALALLSMFYHSAIRVELPWMDYVLVTPQVHRLHHAVDPRYHNRNFADVFPVLDLAFGTYQRPERGNFPATGLGLEETLPGTPWNAQFGPIQRVLGSLARR